MSHINLFALIQERIESDNNISVTAHHYGTHYRTVQKWKCGEGHPSIGILQQALDEYLLRRPIEDVAIGSGKVLILMPIHNSVHGKTHATMTKALADFGRDKVEVVHQFGTDIDRARCLLAARALSTDSEWFIFSDADELMP